MIRQKTTKRSRARRMKNLKTKMKSPLFLLGLQNRKLLLKTITNRHPPQGTLPTLRLSLDRAEKRPARRPRGRFSQSPLSLSRSHHTKLLRKSQLNLLSLSSQLGQLSPPGLLNQLNQLRLRDLLSLPSRVSRLSLLSQPNPLGQLNNPRQRILPLHRHQYRTSYVELCENTSISGWIGSLVSIRIA